jgi:hypothetical protein
VGGAAVSRHEDRGLHLFVDWCVATDRPSLPADPTTALRFLAACPAAPATRRRRVIAIDHHHRRPRLEAGHVAAVWWFVVD